MSRQTKYELLVRTGIKGKITLTKTSDAKTPFKQGKDGRCLRTVRVLAKEDATPTCTDDIEYVVAWADIESMYAYRDPETGEEKYLPVDKKAITSMYTNSNNMQVIGIHNLSDINPMMYDGYHYFIGIQKDSKTKEMSSSDIQFYSLLYQGLSSGHQCMLVKYISSNRPKFAIIHPVGEGLTMSNLTHSTYMRERDPVKQIVIPNVSALFNKLIRPLIKRKVDIDDLVDECELNLKKYINDLKSGKPSLPKLTLMSRPVTMELSLLEQISALD